MSDFFGIENLIILGIAVAIFLRLRSVLGRRTGNERPPYDPYTAKPRAEAQQPDAGHDNVVTLPRQSASTRPPAMPEVDVDARLKGIAQKGSPLFDNLKEIIEADASFEPKRFTEGASMAYEMIVTAFANGERDSLRPLLSAEVFEGFDAAISAREEASQTMSTTLIGIESLVITEASLKDSVARVTTRVESQMITATYDGENELVSGDPNKVTDVVDVWTFERNVTAKDPNWTLVATESA
ncbi:MAG: Tim44/TimA family putative adaptor protein [Pseudomonadota bacterium]